MSSRVVEARQRLGIAQEIDLSRYSSIIALVDECIEKYADNPVFSSLGQTISYRELGELSKQFAAFLQHELSLKPGDRLAIQLPNLIQYPVVLFGALRAGVVVVNTNPLYSVPEIEHQLNDSGAKALVVLANVMEAAAEAIANTSVEHVIVTELADLHSPIKRTLINFAARYIKKMVPDVFIPGAMSFRDSLKRGAKHQFTPQALGLEDLAVLQYTGGTTGVAKGAMLSHKNLVANGLQCSEIFVTYGFNSGSETMVAPLPLYHIYSFTMSIVALMKGAHTVLIPNPRDIEGLIKEMGRWPMTYFCGLNTLFVALCNHPEFLKLDFSKLRLSLSGGMALTADAARHWEEVTGSQIYEGYGLTETSPVVSVNPGGGNQIGTIGIAVPSTEVKVISEMGETLAEGEPGELCVRGPQVMQGYWQRPQETADVLDEDGWLRTGDMAVVAEDGYLRIVDRKKDLIIVSGFNVYPNEVENVLTQHPKVQECAAVGVPDPASGELVKVFIVANGERPSEQELIDFCRRQLTGYKIPKLFEFRDELPKSNVGKVLRRKLRS